MTLIEVQVKWSVILKDRLGPDNFSTLQIKGHVLHRVRAHLKVPFPLLTKKLSMFLSRLNEISGGCEKILPVCLALVFFIPQISDQQTNHKTMPSLNKLTKELRQEIVSYLFPFPPISQSLAFRLAIPIFATSCWLLRLRLFRVKLSKTVSNLGMSSFISPTKLCSATSF